MDKRKLVDAILEKLRSDLNVLVSAAKATREAATHEESKPENEYDTRGLEASYLAGAQAKRVAETEAQITMFKFLELRHFKSSDKISASALVKVDLEGKVSFVFMVPKGGGLSLEFEGQVIQTVTPQSPLGEALVGLKTGDVALVEIGRQTREYEILFVE